MSEGHFYWLKLKRDFFKRHDVRVVESLPGGRDALLIYLKLMAESVDHEGRLRFSERLPYTPDMLATVIGEEPGRMAAALELLQRFGMAEWEEDGTLKLPEVVDMIGSAADNPNANRQRRYRQKKAAKNDGVTKNNERQRLETETETETETRDRERDRDRDKTGRCRRLSVPPSVTEVKRYCDEEGISVDAEQFCEYFDGEDWKVNGERIRNWRSVIQGWEEHRRTG